MIFRFVVIIILLITHIGAVGCDSATDIFVAQTTGIKTKITTSSTYVSRYYPTPVPVSVKFDTLEVTSLVAYGAETGHVGFDRNDCDLLWAADAPNALQVEAPSQTTGLAKLKMECKALATVGTQYTPQLSVQDGVAAGDLDSIQFKVDCLSYCSAFPLQMQTRIDDLIVEKNLPSEFVFSAITGSTEADCAITIKDVTCLTGCTDPAVDLGLVLTKIPNVKMDFNVPTSGVYQLQFNAFYTNYEHSDTTANYVQSFKLTVIDTQSSCEDFMIYTNNWKIIEPNVFIYQPATFTLELASSPVTTVNPSLLPCDFKYTDDSSSGVTITEIAGPPKLQISITTVTDTLANIRIHVQYDGVPSSKVQLTKVTFSNVKRCTDNWIKQNSTPSVQTIYIGDNGDLDFNSVFTNIGTGDYANSNGICKLRYKLPTSPTPPPTWLTLPNVNKLELHVAPEYTHLPLATYNVAVEVFYKGYNTDYPAATKHITIVFELKALCQDHPLVWPSSFQLAYTVKIGQPQQITYAHLAQTAHVTKPTLCKLEYVHTPGSNIWSATGAQDIIRNQIQSGTGGRSFDFTIQPEYMTQVSGGANPSSWSYEVTLRYKEFNAGNGYSALESKVTFLVTVQDPDSCNTATYGAIAAAYSSHSWTVDLCTATPFQTAHYSQTAPFWCGTLNYLSSSTPSSIFTHSIEATTQTVTILAQTNVSYLTGGPYQVMIRPDYTNDPDETNIFHVGDTITVTYVSPCDNYSITQTTVGATNFDFWVLDATGAANNEVVSTVAFTNAGEVYCPTDCVQKYVLTCAPADGSAVITTSYNQPTNKLTVQSNDETQIGVKSCTIVASYNTHPTFVSEQFAYTFTITIKSICERDALVQINSDTEIFIQEKIRIDKKFSLGNWWSNHGVEHTPIDCVIEYRVVNTLDNILTIDNATQEIILRGTAWSQLGEASTTLEVYFKNYSPSITRNSISLRTHLDPNCEEPVTWTKIPASITNHIFTFSINELIATSDALTYAPVECVLKLTYIDNGSPTLPATDLIEFKHLTSASMELKLSKLQHHSFVGSSYSITIAAIYEDTFYAGYDPLSATTSIIYINIIAECPGGIKSYTSTTQTPQIKQYLIGSGPIPLNFDFVLTLGATTCQIQEYIQLVIDNQPSLSVSAITLDRTLNKISLDTNDSATYLGKIYSCVLTATAFTEPTTQCAQSLQFKVVFVDTIDPCLEGVFLRTPDKVLPNMKFMIKGTTEHEVQPFLPFTFDKSPCPAIVYNFPDDSINHVSTSLDQTNSAAMFFDTFTNDQAHIGTYTIKLELSLFNYPYKTLIEEVLTFQLIISSVCEISTIQLSSNISQQYLLAGVPANVQIPIVPTLQTIDPSDGSVITFCGAYTIKPKLVKRIGSLLNASATILPVSQLIECCSTLNENDYGWYDINLDITLDSYAMKPVTTLSQVAIEILPDCQTVTFSLLPTAITPFEIFSHVGKTGQLDLSSAFTHSFDGKYADYCGIVSVDIENNNLPYLSINAHKMVTSAPTLASQISSTGENDSIYIYLPNWEANNSKTYQIISKVLPYCQIIKYEALVQQRHITYIIDSTAPSNINMSFATVDYTADSTMPYCEDHRTSNLHFTFDHLGVQDQRPEYFKLVDNKISFLETSDPLQAGTYSVRIKEDSDLPSGNTFSSLIEQVVEIEIIYDPCLNSKIEDQTWEKNWEYRISPSNGEDFTDYQIPLFTNDVTRLKPGYDCGPMKYTLLGKTLLETDGVQIKSILVAQVIDKVSLFTKDNKLHSKTYTFDLKVTMIDYPTLLPLESTITVNLVSNCIDSKIVLISDDSDYRTWWANNDEINFNFQVGQFTPRVFQAPVSDQISASSSYTGDPFCGKLKFTLTDESHPTKLKLVGADPSLGYYPSLSLYANELDYVQEADLNVYGVYGNDRLIESDEALVQKVTATLNVILEVFDTLNFPSIDIRGEFKIKGLLVNKCERVFLYKSLQTPTMKVRVEKGEKKLLIGAYFSYLNFHMADKYSYSALLGQPMCGTPEVLVRCFADNEVSTTIRKADDLVPFTEEFLNNIYDLGNFEIENPLFLDVVYDSDGSTLIIAKTDLDIWSVTPYVCLIDAFIDQEWRIARSNDFLIVTVLGSAIANSNVAPAIEGLDSEYLTTIESAVQGQFQIIDNDDFDLGELSAILSITGTEVTQDCGCLTFEAEYELRDGSRGTDTIEGALKKNKKLTTINVKFRFEPNQALQGKSYELTLSVSDQFSNTQASFAFVTEGEPVDETETQVQIEFVGVVVKDEVEVVEQKKVDSVKFNTKQFWNSGPALSQVQINARLKALRDETEYPIPFMSQVNEEGLVDIWISREIAVPTKAELPKFMHSLTYQHVIEFIIISEDTEVRGEPRIAVKSDLEKPKQQQEQQQQEVEGQRDLQQSSNSALEGQNVMDVYPFLIDTWNSTAERYNDFTRASDINQKFIVESRAFNWNIEDMTSTKMIFKLSFQKPELVSSYSNDVLIMRVMQPNMFLVQNPNDYYKPERRDKLTDFWNIDFSDSMAIPKQKQKEASQAAAAAQATGQVGMQILTIINLVVAGFMQMSLDELWIVINSLSFIVYLPLFQLIFPDNVMVVMEAFLSVVTFDIVETLDGFGITLLPFDFIETPPYNSNFEELGYETSNSIQLLGSVNLIIILMMAIFFISVMVYLIKPCRQTRFGRYVRQKFTFKGQLSGLNRLMITGAMELLVCSVVNVMPSQLSDRVLIEYDFDELDSIDQFALCYGLVILIVFCIMIVVYLLVIIYLAPKVSLVSQQKSTEEFFVTNIRAYQTALKDIRRARDEKEEEEKMQIVMAAVKEEEGFKNEDIAVKEVNHGEFGDPQRNIVLHSHQHQKPQKHFSSDNQASQPGDTDLNSDQHFITGLHSQQPAPDALKYSTLVNDRSNDLIVPITLEIDHFSSMLKDASPEKINMMAAQVAGHAIILEEEDPLNLEVELKKKAKEEEEAALNGEEPSEEVIRARHLEETNFKYLYKKAIVQSEDEIVNRIKQLDEQRRRNHKKGLVNVKLTKFQINLKDYFSDLFDGISEKSVLNYYYLFIYFARRIIFVFTAINLTEYPHFQLIVTYLLCLLMLSILVGSRPYKVFSATVLESINEFVVLFLLEIAWLMLVAISIFEDPERSLELYSDLGLIFRTVLVSCIAINFIRIVGTMCVQVKKKYELKWRRMNHRAAMFDRQVNFVSNSRNCNCQCYTCSHDGLAGTVRHDRENWGPVQPRQFSLMPVECLYDVEAGYHRFTSKFLDGGKAPKIEVFAQNDNFNSDGAHDFNNSPMGSSANQRRVRPQELNSRPDSAASVENDEMKRRRARLIVASDGMEAALISTNQNLAATNLIMSQPRLVRFEEDVEAAKAKAMLEKNNAIKAVKQQKRGIISSSNSQLGTALMFQNQFELVIEHGDADKPPSPGYRGDGSDDEVILSKKTLEIVSRNPEKLSGEDSEFYMKKLLDHDEQEYIMLKDSPSGLLSTNTRQVRHRDWLSQNVWLAETDKRFRSKHRNKQGRLRHWLHQEAALLKPLQEGVEKRKAAEQLEFGPTIMYYEDRRKRQLILGQRLANF